MTALSVPPPPPTGYPLPASPPRYSFVAGTWGDVICALGNHQHLMRSLGCEAGALLYYGPDPTIADWLRMQPMVSDVIDVRSPGQVSGIPTDPARVGEWWPVLANAGLEVTVKSDREGFTPAGLLVIRADEIYPCHVDFTLRERLPVHRPELVTAPEVAEWAAEMVRWSTDMVSGNHRPARRALPIARKPRILFQPRSETSCLWEGHWPYWMEAFEWMIPNAGAVLLCGQAKRTDTGEFWPESWDTDMKIINMVNHTSTMPHLFALADVCDAVVTTSNALSLYCAAKGLPTVVCCNVTHRRPEQYFTRFAKGPRSRIVEHHEGMDVFKAAWAEVRGL